MQRLKEICAAIDKDPFFNVLTAKEKLQIAIALRATDFSTPVEKPMDEVKR